MPIVALAAKAAFRCHAANPGSDGRGVPGLRNDARRLGLASARGRRLCRLRADHAVSCANSPQPTHRVAVPVDLHLSRSDMKSQPVTDPHERCGRGCRRRRQVRPHWPAAGFVFARISGRFDESEDDFVAVAELFLNVPYLWGGKTPRGLDCSGLVQTVARSRRDSTARATPTCRRRQLGSAGQRSRRSQARRPRLLGWPCGHHDR